MYIIFMAAIKGHSSNLTLQVTIHMGIRFLPLPLRIKVFVDHGTLDRKFAFVPKLLNFTKHI
jgi:hypothetical protein